MREWAQVTARHVCAFVQEEQSSQSKRGGAAVGAHSYARTNRTNHRVQSDGKAASWLAVAPIPLALPRVPRTRVRDSSRSPIISPHRPVEFPADAGGHSDI